MLVVETKNLTKIYAGKYIAVNDLNLQVREGSVFGLVGPNGSGKTTTFRLLLGLQKPTAGQVKVFGEPMTANAAHLRQRVGFLPTNPQFPKDLTPIKYLSFIGAISGLSRETTMLRLASLLRAVDLLPAASQKIEGFSTGMMTRLGIAASLMNDPELLIWDEPTLGLDPAGRKQIFDLIRKLSVGRTIMLSTHVLTDVERVCSDVAILHQGRLIFSGSMAEMRQSLPHQTLVLELDGNIDSLCEHLTQLDNQPNWKRSDNVLHLTFPRGQPLAAGLAQVLSAARETGVELVSISTAGEQMEEAFLRRVEEDSAQGLARAVSAPSNKEGPLSGPAAG